MEKVFSSQQINEVGMLKSILEEQGIDCAIRNEFSSMAMGEIPFTEIYPELWIVNDSDSKSAHQIIEDWANGTD